MIIKREYDYDQMQSVLMPSTPLDLPHLILFKASKMLKGVTVI